MRTKTDVKTNFETGVASRAAFGLLLRIVALSACLNPNFETMMGGVGARYKILKRKSSATAGRRLRCVAARVRTALNGHDAAGQKDVKNAASTRENTCTLKEVRSFTGQFRV